MAKTKEQKKEILENLSKKIKEAKSIVFAQFNALGVKDNESLRKKLREENSEYVVAKKTLLEIAFKEKKIENLNPGKFEGKVAAVFGYQDEVAPARILAEFKKDHDENINFISGILENKLLLKDEIVSLSKMPGKTELHSKIVGSLNAPISGFVNVMAGNLRSLIYALKAIEGKKS